MAVAVENWYEGSLNDQSIFKVVAQINLQTNTGLSGDFYTLHPCTETDYAKFHPVEKKAAAKVETLKERKSFFCLDWENLDLELYGHWATTSIY